MTARRVSPKRRINRCFKKCQKHRAQDRRARNPWKASLERDCLVACFKRPKRRR